MTLDVYFGSAKAGELHSTDNRGIVFSYSRDYLADKDVQSLSASLPLREKEFSQKECLPFFSGLLPEGDSRKKLADYLHISETSTLRLLEALGGECAGLVTITADTQPVLPQTEYALSPENYERLDDDRLADFISRMNIRPLIKADGKLRLSLAGAQEKIALARFDGEWHLPMNGAPSTHILKPAREGMLSTLAINEYTCMRLAKLLGLPAPTVDLAHIAGRDVLVEERYDRIRNGGSVRRLHQEDFCQALGIMSTAKYQNDGGPGIADILGAIRKHCSVPAVETQKFLRAVVFNYLIGNCDSHGKNYALLYKGRATELAPLYDAVSTAIYPDLTDKLSMKIGRHYEIGKVTHDDFSLLADTLGIKDMALRRIFGEFRSRAGKAFETLKSDEKISGEVLGVIQDGLRGRLDRLGI